MRWRLSVVRAREVIRFPQRRGDPRPLDRIGGHRPRLKAGDPVRRLSLDRDIDFPELWPGAYHRPRRPRTPRLDVLHRCGMLPERRESPVAREHCGDVTPGNQACRQPGRDVIRSGCARQRRHHPVDRFTHHVIRHAEKPTENKCVLTSIRLCKS